MKAFERRGVAVLTFDEKHSNRVRDKILYRLGMGHHRLSPLPRHLRQVTDQIVEACCTDVLLVGVEVIDRPFVERLVKQGIRVHFYTWDGTANKDRFLTYLDLLDSKATFDPNDSRDHRMAYIPLFAEALFDERLIGMAPARDQDIGFCGTVHSSRAGIIAALMSIDRPRPLRLGLMLYYHSRRLFGIKALVSRSARRVAPLISDTPFSKSAIADMFVRSRYILDVPHPGQSGMTARTFETLLAGARLLTLNASAEALLPSSFANRVTVIGDIADLASIDFDAVGPLPPLTHEQTYFLSLDRFLDQLSAMMRLPA
ncbi:hypothetical protein IFT67_16915 [Sphingomonas sp. CFBP 13728]|uniref:hypothetical protein n=1 Tax=Sphingomonas sp. CFBP 13728 TaxID=2775294 RepID=UPI00178719DC|nr:hypothetical protein [Sphingomonas sp. CFBP 13728]MBD8620605.1 hypothetical protein [Sphingomonas sp. CFBP 13728]